MFRQLCAASLFGLSLSLPSEAPFPHLFPRDACAGNTAYTRSEWCDFSINSDYDSVVPDTGVTREYWLEITDGTFSPDGFSRYAMSVNNSIPGPTIFADWGDNVVVHVTNSLTQTENGTSLHFHGIRQNYTNPNDGVSSITQCPTPPGSSITYTWRATQHGTTWYHSHFGVQAWNGVFGGIVINGPATENYDVDAGILFLNDWSHSTADELYYYYQLNGPPTLENGLINGTNVYGGNDDDSQTGSRFTFGVSEGTSYRIRLVNGAADTFFKYSVDNHNLTVIAMDLVPIEPFSTDIISLGPGQRYDVILKADQITTAQDFWMRAIPQATCSENGSEDNIRGVLYYGESAGTPSTTAFNYTDSCDDMNASQLIPYISNTVDSPTLQITESATVAYGDDGLYWWYLNDTSFSVQWDNPTIVEVKNNQTTFNETQGVFQLPEANSWTYLVMESNITADHPVHLHGHDFYVLAQGTGSYNTSITLNLDNPPKRDTAMLVRQGYLVIAWKNDNPGIWLMHCHIAWHQATGFALQFIERYSEVQTMIAENLEMIDGNCDAWNAWENSTTLVQADSGI